MLKKVNLRAFSLVEVALAVGIVSIGIITMLGIMPIGLSTMREAMDATVRTQIVQQVAGEAMALPYSKLHDLINAEHYFDGEGRAQTKKDASTRFEVTISQGDAIYPGSFRAGDLEESATTLRIEVRLVPGNNAVSNHVVLVPNRGG